jgi:glutamate racemase
VRDVLEVPIVGTVPAIKPAAAMTQTGVIGLLGTQATIRQAYVDRLEAEFAADKLLLRHGAPDLVAAAEARLRGRRWTRRSSHAPWRPARQPGASGSTPWCWPARTFRCWQASWAQPLARGAFYRRISRIARQIAFLTQGQHFERRSGDLALFTRAEDFSALTPTLAARGAETGGAFLKIMQPRQNYAALSSLQFDTGHFSTPAL